MYPAYLNGHSRKKCEKGTTLLVRDLARIDSRDHLCPQSPLFLCNFNLLGFISIFWKTYWFIKCNWVCNGTWFTSFNTLLTNLFKTPQLPQFLPKPTMLTITSIFMASSLLWFIIFILKILGRFIQCNWVCSDLLIALSIHYSHFLTRPTIPTITNIFWINTFKSLFSSCSWFWERG